ncbi:hypothetical protein GGX14DRAFT_397403 [Mycena pura]|uniref:Uncharacterized protein n=1 Tax=Mycena pura TaxID=153505 RepID=A0AAD6VCC7_9AGAR|nr:hypothetical protein GGX14DRAFT_397403 [Mycena pura]
MSELTNDPSGHNPCVRTPTTTVVARGPNLSEFAYDPMRKSRKSELLQLPLGGLRVLDDIADQTATERCAGRAFTDSQSERRANPCFTRNSLKVVMLEAPCWSTPLLAQKFSTVPNNSFLLLPYDDCVSHPPTPLQNLVFAIAGTWARIDAAPRVVCTRGRIGAKGMLQSWRPYGDGEINGDGAYSMERVQDGGSGPWRWSADRPSMPSLVSDRNFTRSMDCPGQWQGRGGTGYAEGQTSSHGVRAPSGTLKDSRLLVQRVEHGMQSGRITTAPSSTTSRSAVRQDGDNNNSSTEYRPATREGHDGAAAPSRRAAPPWIRGLCNTGACRGLRLQMRRQRWPDAQRYHPGAQLRWRVHLRALSPPSCMSREFAGCAPGRGSGAVPTYGGTIPNALHDNVGVLNPGDTCAQTTPLCMLWKYGGRAETLDSRSPCDSSEMSDEAQIKLKPH